MYQIKQKIILTNLKIKKQKHWKKIPQNPVDTIVYPPSFPRVHNYFGVCGHDSVPRLICTPH